jgi:hypothetical protein
MKSWDLETVEFAEGVYVAMETFLAKNPRYQKVLEDRINDLLNFPDLVWQSAHMENENEGYFVTTNQQINLAGKAFRNKKLILITYFSFHS